MEKLKFAVLGCGFWSNYQISAWGELEGVELVAVCDKVNSKARGTAKKFNIPRYYDDAEKLFEEEPLDFVDIITDVNSHSHFVEMAASYQVPVICQKPMAPDLTIAQKMVNTCKKADTPFFIHENFRWQASIRKLKTILDSGVIGIPFKARVTFCSSFPVFENQPFLAKLEQFILTDVGSHILDVCRYLFGEVHTLYCKTKSINPGIKGEDVANVLMEMHNGMHCYAEMSYASLLENERFPQTFALVEGNKGSIELAPDFEIRVTTHEGIRAEIAEPKMYSWADPDYAVVHSSIVDTNRDILRALQRRSEAETTGQDNLKTVQLIFAAYDSARTGTIIKISEFSKHIQNE